MEDDGDLLGELFGFSAKKSASVSPPRPSHQRSITDDEDSNSSSDDDFALPEVPAPAARAAPSAELSASLSEGKAVSVSVGSAAAAATVTELTAAGEEDAAEKNESTSTAAAGATVPSDTNGSVGDGGNNLKTIEQTKLEESAQVAYQKTTHWDTITPGQFVWHQSYPAIVVPERLLAFTPVSGPEGGVLAYGPSSKNVTPSSKRFVVLHYLPLCCTSYAKPETPYAKIGGRKVESVLPYNTLMQKGSKSKCGAAAGRERELGAKEEWADKEYHFRQLSKKYRGLKRESWDASLDHAQKFLRRALELEDVRAEQAREDSRIAKEELEQQRQRDLEMKLQEDEERGGEGDGEGDGTTGDGDAAKTATEWKSTAVEITPGLPLAPGDRIFYWDRTRVVGVNSSRREATIIEIRNRNEAREAGLERLVLDNHEIVLDDWVIQRFITDKKTGSVTLDQRGNQVKKHKLKVGKLEGSNPRQNKHMEGLMADFREKITAFGAGDQLRGGVTSRADVGSDGSDDFDDTEDSDDDFQLDSRPCSKKQTKGKKEEKTVGAAENSTGLASKGGRGGHSSGGGGDGNRSGVGAGGSASAGRNKSTFPLGEEDAGDAIGASIAACKSNKEVRRKGGDKGASTPKDKASTVSNRAKKALSSGGGGAEESAAKTKAHKKALAVSDGRTGDQSATKKKVSKPSKAVLGASGDRSETGGSSPETNGSKKASRALPSDGGEDSAAKHKALKSSKASSTGDVSEAKRKAPEKSPKASSSGQDRPADSGSSTADKKSPKARTTGAPAARQSKSAEKSQVEGIKKEVSKKKEESREREDKKQAARNGSSYGGSSGPPKKRKSDGDAYGRPEGSKKRSKDGYPSLVRPLTEGKTRAVLDVVPSLKQQEQKVGPQKKRKKDEQRQGWSGGRDEGLGGGDGGGGSGGGGGSSTRVDDSEEEAEWVDPFASRASKPVPAKLPKFKPPRPAGSGTSDRRTAPGGEKPRSTLGWQGRAEGGGGERKERGGVGGRG